MVEMTPGAVAEETPHAAIHLPGGVTVPALGVGTWAWGDRSTWGMGGYDTTYDEGTIREAFEASLAAGVTFFDTAEVYGDGASERILGALLAELPAAERPVIATKFMPWPVKWRVAKELRASLEASLERLRLDAVDLYQIHGPISLRSLSAQADALADVVEAKLVKAVGVSNFSARETRSIHASLARRGVALATNQVETSLLRTHPFTSGLVEACRAVGVMVLAYSPIGQGRLTGKYSAEHPPPEGRGFSAYPMAEVEPLLAELRRIGAAHGDRTPAQVALRWLIEKGTVPIPGAKNRKQAEQNAGALDFRLTPDEVAALDRLAKPGIRSLKHRIWQHG